MSLKITLSKNTVVPKGVTEVIYTPRGVEHFTEKDDIMTLTLVSGKLEKVTQRTLRTLIREVVQSAKKYKLKKVALRLNPEDFKSVTHYGTAWFWKEVALNLHLAHYEFTRYKSKETLHPLTEVMLLGVAPKQAQEAATEGETIARFMNQARDIANTPGGDMTPELLGNAAKRILKGTGATVKVLNDTEIKKLKMGGLLGVGQGAVHKPRFIIIEYKSPKAEGSRQKNKNEGPIVFVGKGITFDTGGLQVKPGMAMYEMHMDMSGGAAVIGAIGAIASRKIKTHVIGLIPAAENAISDTAMRPGDVLTMMSGTTVDVLHTDAEGRLVLADALHYARRYNPRLVVDVATLTGAALVAVGQHANIIMTKDRELEDSLRELGEESGDYVFPLPLWDEYLQYTKGVHGDIANIPANDTRNASCINGGMFLSHFTKKLKWVHIDMVPRMTATASDKLARGATGEPIRLLVSIANSF